jgi:hypothetical protein
LDTTRWTPCRPHQGNWKTSDEKQLVVNSDSQLKWTTSWKSIGKHVGLALFVLPLLPLGIVLIVGPWTLAFSDSRASPAMEFAAELTRPPADVAARKTAETEQADDAKPFTLADFFSSLGKALLMSLVGFPLGVFCVLILLAVIVSLPANATNVIFNRDRDRSYRIGWGHHVSEGQTPVSADRQSHNSPRRGGLWDIYAVQVIGERLLEKVPDGTHTEWREGKARTRTSYRDQSFIGYEINLVLISGQRVNVVDHGDANLVHEEADTLARFLGVDVWDDSFRGSWKFEASSLYQSQHDLIRSVQHPFFKMVLFLKMLVVALWKHYSGRGWLYGSWTWHAKTTF